MNIIRIILLICLLSTMACTHLPPAHRQPPAQPSASTAYYHYSLGVQAILRGDLDGAIDEYNRALSLDSRSPYLLTELATLYLRKKNTDEALSLLKRALTVDPDYIDAHLLLAGTYSKLKQYDLAIASYNSVIALDAGKLEAYLFLGLLYREQKEYSAAIATLKDLLKIEDDNLMGTYYLAKIYSDMKSFDDAEMFFKKSLAIKPSFEPALTDLAHLYEIRKDDAGAVHYFSSFVNEHPSSVNARLYLGKTLFRQDRYSEAVEEFLQILKVNGSHMEARYSLGLAYLFGGDEYQKAIKEFEAVLAKFPRDGRTRYFLASAYEKDGQRAPAFEAFKAVPRDSDLYTSARTRMALILKGEHRIPEAIDLISKTIAVAGDEADLYGLLASLYDAKGEPGRAEKVLQEALERFPDDIDLHYKLGLLYEKTNRFTDSVKEMREILKIDENNAEALNFIGYGYVDRGIHLDEAEILIQRAVALEPDNGFITDSLGWLYFKTGRLELAIEYLEKASGILPEDPTITEHLGDAYRKAGMTERARRMYLRALRLGPLKKDILRHKIDQLKGD